MACFDAQQLGEGVEASAGLPCLSDVGGARPALRSRRLSPLRDIPPRPAAEAIAPRLRRRPYGLEDLPGRTSSDERQYAQSLPRNRKDRAQAAKEDGAAARGRCPAKPRDLRAPTPSQKTLRPGGKPGRRGASQAGTSASTMTCGLSSGRRKTTLFSSGAISTITVSPALKSP